MNCILSLSSKPCFRPIYFLLIVFFVNQFAPEDWQNLLAYNQESIFHGEWWRLLTAHFVHLSWTHLIMNCLAFVAFLILYGDEKRAGLLLFLTLSLSVSLGLLFFNPAISRYVGFSGVLTGGLVAGALLSFNNDRLVNSGVLAFIVMKVVYEQWQGGEVISSALSGVPTVVDSHLYGFLVAVMYCFMVAVSRELKRERAK